MNYRESSFPAVSVPADSQPADFLGALLVLFRWVPYEVSTQVLVLKVNFFVICGCKMVDLSVIYQILWVQQDQRDLWDI